MGGCHANQNAATPGSGRTVRTFAALTAALYMAAENANSQTKACSDLVAEMAAQTQLISIYERLEYEIRGHFLLEANAILSTYGGWDSVNRLSVNNAGKFRTSKDDYERVLLGIKRDIGRNKVVTEDELHNFDDAVAVYTSLIETGDQISTALLDGKVNDANQLYYAVARPNYLQVHGTLYTLISSAEKRVAAMARTPCD